MRRTYSGRDVEVSFDLDVCIHVGACLAALPEVFELRRQPWILPDAAHADAVAEAVRRCPSGALRYRRLDGGAEEQAESPATVVPLRNGPLTVRGALEVTTSDGSVDVTPRATLCRCGHSATKPFCDNSHLAAGFSAEGARIRVSATPVRPRPDQPMTKADDPRE